MYQNEGWKNRKNPRCLTPGDIVNTLCSEMLRIQRVFLHPLYLSQEIYTSALQHPLR